MQAVTQDQYGGTEQLRLEEIPEPMAGPGEVRVRVRAAGVDRGTWHLMTGLPYAARLALGLRRPKVRVLGRDVAGIVDTVGDGVSGVSVGDEVMGTARGSFAEVAVVPATRLTRKPDGISFDEAATLPISAGTALQAVRHAGVARGQRVLVVGASGGVGTHLVQLAVAIGAEVTGVASGSKAGLVRDLGAAHVIDYTRAEIGDDGGVFDVIIDLAGLRPLRLLRRSLTEQGTLVIAGGEGGDRWLGGTHRQLAALATSPFTRQRLTALMSQETTEVFSDVASAIEDGSLRPQLERTYPLADAAKAIDHLAAGHARGKVAITV